MKAEEKDDNDNDNDDDDDDADCALIADDDKDKGGEDDEVTSVEDPATFLSGDDSEETKGFVETDSRRCSLAPTS